MGGLARHGLTVTISLFALSAWGQEREPDESDAEESKLTLSFAHDPRELHENAEKAFRWKRILDSFGIGEFHVFPSREAGPYVGPPRRIWSNGFGTSLWRDPVTGWPLQ